MANLAQGENRSQKPSDTDFAASAPVFAAFFRHAKAPCVPAGPTGLGQNGETFHSPRQAYRATENTHSQDGNGRKDAKERSWLRA